MADSFTEYENATEMPRVANPGAPEQMEPKTHEPYSPPPHPISEKACDDRLKKYIKNDKIRWYIIIISGFLFWFVVLVLLHKIITWPASKIETVISEPIIKEKVIYKTAKPKIIYKTKWKDRVVYRDKVIVQEVSDTALLMKLKKENQILRDKLAKQDKHLQLHKMAIRKFFKNPRSRKLSIETSRQYW